ncbi:MAG: hypothetical protein AAFU79_12370 [Myxococcota bacterium]
MMKVLAAPALLLAGLALAVPAFAEEDTPLNVPAAGSVSTAEGLMAWKRIYEVASHPRCANCHVGANERPMWSGPTYGRTRVHGMNVVAGASRIGAESGMVCSTCHVTAVATQAKNDVPHAAPRVAAAWRLAPAEAHWFGKSSEFICQQLRDKEQNGGRTFQEVAQHLGHDVILHWAWTPGGGREPAPYSLEEHVADILAWGVAGMPCPGDE